MDRDRKTMKMEKQEEENMDKLYTLLKNAKEVRKYIISSMEKKKQEEEKARVHRFSSFQPEDFVFMNKEAASRKNNEKTTNASSSTSNKYGSKVKQEESETNICLDLNLSL